MGAAQTKNASEAVTNVTNYVNNSTVADTTQKNNVKQQVIFDSCSLKIGEGGINIDESADLYVQNSQIVKAKNNNSLDNNIQQKMLQEAASTVGSLGIGYADASNSTSIFANASSEIINSISESAGQYSNVNQSVVCTDSYIEAPMFNVKFSSKNDFLSSQTLDQDTTSKVVNDVSQTATQKATAKVEGLAAFILALAILIASFGYAIAKPLTTGPFKILLVFIIVLLLTGVGVFMFLRKTPPLFDDVQLCSKNTNLGGCGRNQCKDRDEVRSIDIDEPPLRYLYGLFPGDFTVGNANLIQMSIASVQQQNSGGNNGGYRADAFNLLKKKVDSYSQYAKLVGVPNIPNPLSVPKTDKGEYYKIPDEYLVTQGTSRGSSRCTPGIVQTSESGDSTIPYDSCPQYVSKTSLETTKDASFGIANFNKVQWSNYLQGSEGFSLKGGKDSIINREKFARFVLCDMCSSSIDLSVYMQPDELVKIVGKDGTGKIVLASSCDSCFKFTANEASGFRNGITSGGSLEGKFGVCENREYQVKDFFKNVGIYIFGGLFGVVILYIVLKQSKKGERPARTSL